MSHPSPASFFDKKMSDAYDAKAQKISAINDNLHLLIRLVLTDLPAHARILCVGVGTGSEIAGLALHYPGWHFTGVDPSSDMLDVCRSKVKQGGIEDRCELIHGYLSDVSGEEAYDAVLCLLVTHFIKDNRERIALFSDMHRRLKKGGILINSDISYDVALPEYESILEVWKAMHELSGATPEQAKNIPETLRTHVNVQSPESIEGFLRQAGFTAPVLFFQSLLIHAWYSKK